MVRRILAILGVLACAGVVVAYQVTRPEKAPGSANAFVPSAKFYQDFSPSFRTSIADIYWLQIIQYYGEHLKSDQHFDALPAMLDLITTLSPHFTEPYFFGSLALIDAGDPEAAYRLLQKGFAANPDDWRFPAYLGFFAYQFPQVLDPGEDKEAVAADWYAQSAALPGRPDYIPRLAAALYQKGNENGKAIAMWAQSYGLGDKYTREKAIAALDQLLPKNRAERVQVLESLRDYVPADDYQSFVDELMTGY
jgi:hypothetical protein